MSTSTPLSQEAAFQQLGGILRQLHSALETLGYDRGIRQIANEIPDARDRLAYVGGMTEAAASKVLNLVDAATPGCADMAERADALSTSLDHALSEPGLGSAALLSDCRDFMRRTSSFAETQRSTLTDIMMAQDFQDLSGQVIGKVIDIISRTESQLVELLVNTAPQEVVSDAGELAGPQVPEKALQQDDVDDLLASLGF